MNGEPSLDELIRALEELKERAIQLRHDQPGIGPPDIGYELNLSLSGAMAIVARIDIARIRDTDGIADFRAR